MIDLGAELEGYGEPEKPTISNGYHAGGVLSEPFSIGKLADLEKQGFCTTPPVDAIMGSGPGWRELMQTNPHYTSKPGHLKIVTEPLNSDPRTWRNKTIQDLLKNIPLAALADGAPEFTYRRWMSGDPE